MLEVDASDGRPLQEHVESGAELLDVEEEALVVGALLHQVQTLEGGFGREHHLPVAAELHDGECAGAGLNQRLKVVERLERVFGVENEVAGTVQQLFPGLQDGIPQVLVLLA